ncbi:MAG TPA: hybrid sensor histidine kinase/response regulator [Puia sp.]|nr:hybrid sensor histidine kinase/response regulator [Puia sp.]
MILIVDDRPENIFTLKALLELHDFPIDTAVNGEEALKKVLKKTYALIILDVQMPGMDGFEVAEILSGNNATRDIPIIFLSAINVDKKYITRGYQSGGIDYVTKPIDPDILLLRVKTLYRLYEQNRVLSQMQSDLKQEVEYRKIAQQEAQAASKRKDEFLSMASHELKTPLASIKAYLQLMNRAECGQEHLKTYIDRALGQINKLDSLITDLLDISRVENGRIRFHKTRFDMDRMIRESAEVVHQTYPDYCIKISGEPAGVVFGDEGRLDQVLLNYLTNAVKYSPEVKRIEIQTAISGTNLIVSVKDAGIGIPKQSQPDVFRKFYRVENTERRFQGLGVGLYICAEIIKRHEGNCWLESEPGKGSTFFFSIPVDGRDNNN